MVNPNLMKAFVTLEVLTGLDQIPAEQAKVIMEALNTASKEINYFATQASNLQLQAQDMAQQIHTLEEEKDELQDELDHATSELTTTRAQIKELTNKSYDSRFKQVESIRGKPLVKDTWNNKCACPNTMDRTLVTSYVAALNKDHKLVNTYYWI